MVSVRHHSQICEPFLPHPRRRRSRYIHTPYRTLPSPPLLPIDSLYFPSAHWECLKALLASLLCLSSTRAGRRRRGPQPKGNWRAIAMKTWARSPSSRHPSDPALSRMEKAQWLLGDEGLGDRAAQRNGLERSSRTSRILPQRETEAQRENR